MKRTLILAAVLISAPTFAQQSFNSSVYGNSSGNFYNSYGNGYRGYNNNSGSSWSAQSYGNVTRGTDSKGNS